MDRIINFQSDLVDVLVFCRLTFYFRKSLSREFLVSIDPVNSSMESVTEMTSGNLVHGSWYGHAELPECYNKTIEFMFAGINMFWARLRLILARAARRRLK